MSPANGDRRVRGALKNGKLGNWDFNMSLAITATTTTASAAAAAALKSNWPTSLTNNYEQSEKTHSHTQKDEPKRVSCGPWSASAASSEEYRNGEVRQGRGVDMPQATV